MAVLGQPPPSLALFVPGAGRSPLAWIRFGSARRARSSAAHSATTALAIWCPAQVTLKVKAFGVIPHFREDSAR